VRHSVLAGYCRHHARPREARARGRRRAERLRFRHVEGDAATDALAGAINATGTLNVISSQIDGTRFVRISVGQTHTTHMDVERLWSAISAGARGAS